MLMSPEKLDSTLTEKRVKLHIFQPSKRKIWTVVGVENEYWLDPELDFCSCPGYYFSKKNGEKTCYHLRSLKMAVAQDKLELITFSDHEYENFMSGILSDLQEVILDNKK